MKLTFSLHQQQLAKPFPLISLHMKQVKNAAQPFRSSPGNADQWMKWCEEHKALHSRLDLVEETLDKTVEHLESEVKNLLNLMDGIAWNLPPEPGSPAENFFGDESL
ncbi:placenta-specific protein 9 isoform X3 [Phascolarctos cinereus]|uniref:Placenta-specific protein 9 isoform X3 n=1 Tax=Phascolarctos cinereus TaxID=38626 RepID=A0A6P5LTI9_PHACI|nr:placenta-specific protein 9 isoform X3 [Phascolarctos cinereus]